jgi:hypothetical protein
MGVGSLGVTWRSRLADGTPVAVKRLRASRPDLKASLERLQRPVHPGNAHLLDVLSVFKEDGHLWVAFQMDDGVSLSQLLGLGRLPAACAVAVGIDVLDALTALHEAGLWHGAVHSRNVHVGRGGTARLGDYGLAGEPADESTAALRAADVRAAGALLASTLGVCGRAGTALGLAVRAITGSPRLLPAGHEAAHASLTLWEGARGLASPRRRAQARAHLAALVADILDGSEAGRDGAWL